VHVDVRAGARGLGLGVLGAADLAAVGRDGGVERHVLRFEGGDAQAAARPDAAQRSDEEALAHRRGGALHHEGAALHRGLQAAARRSWSSSLRTPTRTSDGKPKLVQSRTRTPRASRVRLNAAASPTSTTTKLANAACGTTPRRPSRSIRRARKRAM